MTAATSMAKISYFRTRFCDKIKEGKKIFIVNLVLHIIGLPLVAFSALMVLKYMDKDPSYWIPYQSLMSVGGISVVIAIFCGIIIALNNFRYLYTKSLVDMNYSLPITTKQRFFADYLSGLLGYIIPAIIGVILSIIILVTGSNFVDMEIFWRNFDTIIVAGLIVFFGMIMLYTFTVFTISFCGSNFEAIFSIFATGIAIPLTLFSVFSLVNYSIDNIVPEESFITKISLTSTNPIGALFAVINYFDNVISNSDFAIKTFVRWLIPNLIFTAIYLVVAYFLYKYRKAEDVSKPYIYKGFYYAITSLEIFCVLSVFITYEAGIIAGIIVSGIIFFIMEVITKRGFKKFGYSVIRFCVTIAAVFLFFTISKNTEGFGCKNYVPREAAVSGVSVRFDGTIIDIFEDEKVIEETIRLHKNWKNANNENKSTLLMYDYDELKNSVKQEELFQCTNQNVYITYYLNNGSTVSRSFLMGNECCGDLITAMETSEETAQFIANEIALKSFNEKNIINYYVELEDVPKNKSGYIILSNKFNSDSEEKKLSYNQVIALKEAYEKDVNAMTEDEFKNAGIYGYIFDEPVRDTFVNTIAVINELGFKDKSMDKEDIRNYISSGLLVNVYTDVITAYYDYTKYKYIIQEGFTETPRAYEQMTHAEYEDIYFINTKDIVIDDCFVELLEKATPVIINDTVAGAVIINDKYRDIKYYIKDTPENRELVQKVRLRLDYFRKVNKNDVENFFITGIYD